MSFFLIQRAHKNSKRKVGHKKPKIRWHLLGLSDPRSRESASSIDVIRQGVASLAKEYPLELPPVAGRQVVQPKPEGRRSKKKALAHRTNT
ncbi:MAG: hypothetical protein OEV01_13080 [Nitrospira sp.]|nr:hypothetical protein [Nitrospira sp.]MDH4304255.1 hypothetical protein [Nitrospira sp.]MDH5194590.1 hypothetical protein [Nitrospira sp.]